MNRYACESEMNAGERLSSLWTRPRPMTPEQLLSVLLDEHENQSDGAMFAATPLVIEPGSDAAADLISHLDELLPTDCNAHLERELLRLFARLCRAVYYDRQLVPPDRAMLDRMIDFACRNGLIGPSSPGHFWLGVKSTLATFNKIFSAQNSEIDGWSSFTPFRNGPTLHHGSGLREDFWEYVVLGGERPDTGQSRSAF